MESGRLSSSIQIVTAIAVLVEPGLVVWELRQVKTLTRAQLTSESAAINNAIHTATLGDDAAAALAKACTNPQELTLREAKILDSFYLANANLPARLVLHSDRDGVYEEGKHIDVHVDRIRERFLVIAQTRTWPGSIAWLTLQFVQPPSLT